MSSQRGSIGSSVALTLLVFLGVVCPDSGFAYRAGAPQESSQDRTRLVLAHDNTAFPLTGRHRMVECGSCHVDGVLGGTPVTCEVCHWARRQDDAFGLQLGTHCSDCHTPQNWGRILPGAWEHEQVTGFRLDGQHASLDCTDCHTSRNLRSATTECVQCHLEDYQSAQIPDHQAANFPTDCQLCHFTASRWQGARFDHNFFPLTGPHRVVPCEACHQGGRFAGTGNQCIDCHRAEFESTTNPNHVQGGFSTDCTQCHDPNGSVWQGARFDHDSIFELRGMHKTIECEACHRNEQFTGTPSNCTDCHRSDYEQTRNPNHVQAGFPTDCVSCHGSAATSWRTASFDHDSVFPLKGMHRAADCEQCHIDGRFQGTPSECIDCHRADYDQTRNPNHQQAGFSINCVGCHEDGANGWLGAGFDHERVFPLRGQHRAADCSQCHLNGQFTGTPTNCVDCHRTDYDRTISPNHATAGFSTDCTACHGDQANTWTGANFDHNQFFALRGRHAAADCTQCHINGRYAGTPANCIDCHRTDYDRTTTPNHASAGFSTDCTACHGDQATTWTGASFDHNQFFALRGRHAVADCKQCHINGRYAGTPTNCIDCHRSDYDRTTTPNHASAGFSTDCTACHGSQATTWTGASFDHNQFFALRGKHATADCTQCHINGRYAGTPANCIDCHRSDYDRTTTPNHASAGFSTDCVACHGNQATSWTGASFDHNQFFTLRGKHATADCTQCHLNGRYAGTPTSCIDCHRTDYDRTTNPNHAAAGFGTDCTACHGNGANSWLGATFDHDSVFPLQGAHRTLDCQRCHAAGYNLPTDCNGCHSADYDAARNPDHRRAGFPRTCENCHFPSHTSWTQAVFQHGFPITSGKHAGFECTDCHTTGTMQQFSCIDCHKHAKPQMDDKHKDIGGYTYSTAACYSCHPSGRK